MSIDATVEASIKAGFFDLFGTQIGVSATTGKSLSEALIFASTNLQHDDRLFIELQVQYMKISSSEHGENMLCKRIVIDV